METEEVIQGSRDVYRLISAELHEARNAAETLQIIDHLSKAQNYLFQAEEIGTVLDNFVDEFLQYLESEFLDVKLFLLNFIEQAFFKDPTVLKKLNASLMMVLRDSNTNITFTKKIIVLLTRLYPLVLQWLASKTNDNEAMAVWNGFDILKSRILQMVDSRNEGIRVYLMRFIETIVICQTQKSEFSDLSKLIYDMSLNLVSRGHRFISYRKLETEATLSFKNLLDHLSSSRTSLLHLIAALTAIARIARARPEFVHQMVEAFESLHQNLPPTLGRGQVKSVRKELKNNLLRMLKHPAIFLKHMNRVKSLLQELGAKPNEIDRNSPAPTELSEALKKQVEQANALKRMESASASNMGPLSKKLKLDDEDYDDQKLVTAFDDQEEATKAKQKAIDLTTDWIMERMGGDVVPKLVFINLLTMPDEMPPAFNASYYTIPEVLTTEVKKNVARLLANQFNREGKGPGATFYAEERKKYFLMKQKAKQEGAIIPSTPTDLRDDKHRAKMDLDGFKVPILPVGTKKSAVKFDIFAETQPLPEKESKELKLLIFKRLMEVEMNLSHSIQRKSLYKSLIYMVSRRNNELTPKMEEQLMNFIINDQDRRADLIFLWLAELYNQWKGFTICVRDGADSVTFTEAENHQRYDMLLVDFLRKLYAIEGHKNDLFHRIFVEAIVITQGALGILRKACLDKDSCQLAIPTLRELILTRNRQRHDFLKLLMELTYVEEEMIKTEAITTIKELFEIPYIRAEMREFLLEMCDRLAEKTVPPLVVIACSGFEDIENAGEEEVQWTEEYAKSALTLILHMIPLDTSLINKLTHVWANAVSIIKKTIIGSLKAQISINDDNWLYAIDNCPQGGELLIARFATLLTERSEPTPELVERLRNLVRRYDSDVRILMPIISGLTKEECLDLVPKFVLSSTCLRNVPTFYKKMLRSIDPRTKQSLVSVHELIMKLHSIPNVTGKAATLLASNIDVLIVDQKNEFFEESEKIPTSIEQLAELSEINQFVFHSIEKLYEKYQALGQTIAKILRKCVQKLIQQCSPRKPWEIASDAWEAFKTTVKALGWYGYSSLVSLKWDEFSDALDLDKLDRKEDIDPSFGHKLSKYISTMLSPHEQFGIAREIIQFVRREIDTDKNRVERIPQENEFPLESAMIHTPQLRGTRKDVKDVVENEKNLLDKLLKNEDQMEVTEPSTPIQEMGSSGTAVTTSKVEDVKMDDDVPPGTY